MSIKFMIVGNTLQYTPAGDANISGPIQNKNLDADGGGCIDKSELIAAGLTEQQATDFLYVFAGGASSIDESDAIKAFQEIDNLCTQDNTLEDNELEEFSTNAADKRKAAAKAAEEKKKAEEEKGTTTPKSGTATRSRSATASNANGISHSGTDYSYTIQKGNTYDAIAENVYNGLYADSGVDKATLLPKIKAAIKAYAIAHGIGQEKWPYYTEGKDNVIDLNDALKDIDPQPKAFSKAVEEPAKKEEEPKSKPEVPKKGIDKIMSGFLGNNWMKTIGIIMMAIGGFLGFKSLSSNQQAASYGQNYGAPVANNGGLFGGLF